MAVTSSGIREPLALIGIALPGDELGAPTAGRAMMVARALAGVSDPPQHHPVGVLSVVTLDRWGCLAQQPRFAFLAGGTTITSQRGAPAGPQSTLRSHRAPST
ncbi:hypothetical protein GCM10023222_50020 [Saccharopolyspora cebuensis]